MHLIHHSLKPQILISSREYRYTYVNLEWFVNNQGTGWVGNLLNLHSRLAQPKDEQRMKRSGNSGDWEACEWVHDTKGAGAKWGAVGVRMKMYQRMKGCTFGCLVRGLKVRFMSTLRFPLEGRIIGVGIQCWCSPILPLNLMYNPRHWCTTSL